MKNTDLVIVALSQGRRNRSCQAVHTDGKCVFSYEECIAAPDPNDPDGFLVTTKKWSRTTSKHASLIVFGLNATMKKNVTLAPQEEVNAAMKLVGGSP